MSDQEREIQRETTDEQCPTGVWKQITNTRSSVEEKPKFEIDLLVEGVLEDVILKHEGEVENWFMHKIHPRRPEEGER